MKVLLCVEIDGEKFFKEDIQSMAVKDFLMFGSFLCLKDLEKASKWWDNANPDSYFSAVEYVQELQRTLKEE